MNKDITGNLAQVIVSYNARLQAIRELIQSLLVQERQIVDQLNAALSLVAEDPAAVSAIKIDKASVELGSEDGVQGRSARVEKTD
ncbi:hypothetical protein [Thermogutta sp.]|uniref:hypothetical protein n=1 Tax=Thermogutta sp. TaxID=1962930 RepID=UPI0032209000